MATVDGPPVRQLGTSPSIQRFDAIYFDAGGMLAHEGFTSGLLIIIREILRAFARNQMSVGVLSTVDLSRVRFPDTAAPGVRRRTEDGIEVVEHIFGPDEAGQAATAYRATKELLRRHAPRYIFMSSPAVFLDELDVLYRRWANETDAKVIHIVADHLFPTVHSHEPNLVSHLYQEMRKGTAITLTESIQDKFYRASCMCSTRFKNPFVLDEVMTTGRRAGPGKIGMVNLHPIKGREIFQEVARRMPELDFLIVRNWPDIDEYTATLPNLTIADFFPRPADFYEEISVLLVPSLHEDGPTRVVIEAMINRIPVIANRIGSIPDVGEENAVFVEPPEILGFDLNGEVLVPRLEHVSLERCISDYCQAIELVISRPPPIADRIQRAETVALSYVRDAERTLADLVATWVST